EILQNLFTEMSYDNPLRSEHPEQGFVFLQSALSSFSDLKRAGLTPNEFQKIIVHNEKVIKLLSPLVKEYVPERISKKEINKLEEFLEKIQKIKIPEAPLVHVQSLQHSFFRSLKDALVSYEELDSTTPLSEWKRKEIEKTPDGFVIKDFVRIDKMKALGDLYKDYQKALFDAGYFDFDDMILEVVKALENNETLRQILEERFQYILVDEFQDTNDAQMRLLYSLTSSEVHEGRPNIMAVGDDDQSIYRFQGAEVANMLSFTERFKDPSIISLSKNYRSTSYILDISESIIAQSKSSLRTLLPQIEKKIISANTNLPKGEIHFKTCSTALHEYDYIAREIKKLHESGTAYKDIAVIGRKHATLRNLVPYLHTHSVPVQYEKRQNVFHDPIVMQIITMLRFVDSLSRTDVLPEENLLPAILSFPFWGLNREMVWDISLRAHKQKISWLEVMKNHEIKKISDIGDFLVTIGTESSYEPVERIIDSLIGGEVVSAIDDEYSDEEIEKKDAVGYQSPLRNYYFNGESFSKNKSQYLTFLSALKVFIESLREYKAGSMVSVSDAVRFVDVHEKAGIELLDQSPYIESTNAVTLLTSHKAKGLEFPVVFVATLTDDMWAGRGIPDKLPFPKNITARPSADSVDDKLRLLYVALTRAQHTLYITNYNEHTTGKKVLLSEFMTPHAEKFIQYEGGEMSTLLDIERKSYVTDYTSDETALLKDIIKDYQMPVTHLNNFLNITKSGPHLFLEQNLLRFPQAKTVASVYGTAMHSALEYIYSYQKREGSLPDLSLVLKKAKQEIVEGRLGKVDTRVQIERSEKALTLYMKNHGKNIDPSDLIETNFKNQGVVVGDARITGKIDKMHIAGNTIVVSDWKTGKAKDTWDVTGDEKIQLHNYARQLLFYKLLVEGSHDFNSYSVEQGRLEFLEPVKDMFITLPLEIDGDEINRLKKLIEVVYEKIITLDFPDVSKYSQDMKGCLEFEEDLIEGKV
ncbi:MAG: 3'-5' exonuclease, partial [Minisyncoccota bacterium]